MKSYAQYVAEMALGKVMYNMPNVKALGSQKLNDQFAKVLDRHAGFVFNFVFERFDSGLQDHKNTVAQFENRIRTEMQTAGAITVVLVRASETVQKSTVASVGVKTMPLTPWTRIHRAAHGFINNGGGPISDRYSNIQLDAYYEIRKVLEFVSGAGLLFAFDSVKHHDSGTRIPVEFYREIITEYIWNGGKIRRTNTGTRMYQEIYPQLEQACHEILTKFVGKILIEDYDFQ